MSLPLAGKHCAVMGATGTIGFAIAKAFSHHGAVVSLLARSAVEARPRLEPLLKPYSLHPQARDGAPVRGHEGVPKAHQFIKLDVSNREEIATLFKQRGSPSDESVPVLGALDILVNCAGISQTSILKRTEDREIQDIVDTNLLATVLVCKHAKMKDKGRYNLTFIIASCIINVSSLMGKKGAPGASVYAASKAGVIGLTGALCREMAGRSIRVNALLPGWVESPMWSVLKPELKKAYLSDTPLGRVATPEEVADAAIFLASNGFANNCILNLDGGLSSR